MLSDVRIDPTDTGMGGLRTVEVIETAGLEGVTFKALTDRSGNTLGNSWVLADADMNTRTGYRWASIYGTMGTVGYSETTTDTDNGPMTDVTIRQFVPGDVTINRAAIQLLYGQSLFIRTEDNFGSRRLVGTASEPMRLDKVEYDTQLEAGGRRGTLITFRGMLSQPAPSLV